MYLFPMDVLYSIGAIDFPNESLHFQALVVILKGFGLELNKEDVL
jgi:hypothetical protein